MRVITRAHEDPDCGIKDYFGVELIDEKDNQVCELSFNIQLDCPEDNNLDRAFSDIFNIQTLIQAAYEAGKNGEDLVLEHREEDW